MTIMHLRKAVHWSSACVACAAHLSLPTACTTQRSATLRMSLRTIANLAESEDQTTAVALRRCFSFSSVALVVPRPP